MTVTKPGLYEDLPEEQYHADPVGNSLSSTMAREILKSPAHLRHYMDTPREPKPAFDLGSAVHTLVLGTGWPLRPLEFNSWRTKESKEAAAEARANGEIPLLSTDHDLAVEIAGAVMDHPVAGRLFTSDGTAEVSAFAQDPDSGVWLRGRFDWMTAGGILVDLKTSRTADPNQFARPAWDYGYAIQAAHYLKVHRLATGTPARGFVHVLVEKDAPHLVSVVQLSADFLDLGERQLDRAIWRYKAALDSGQWPGYPTSIHEVTPEAWMEYREENAQEMETT